jgi:hypothetical protein
MVMYVLSSFPSHPDHVLSPISRFSSFFWCFVARRYQYTMQQAIRKRLTRSTARITDNTKVSECARDLDDDDSTPTLEVGAWEIEGNGVLLGSDVFGCSVDGAAVGGKVVGWIVGLTVGWAVVGTLVGKKVGFVVGLNEGDGVGRLVGVIEGVLVGVKDGVKDGSAEGLRLGIVVGALVGEIEGKALVGETVGESVPGWKHQGTLPTPGSS